MKFILKCKLNKLIYDDSLQLNKNKTIFNMSSRKLDITEEIALSKGLKYGINIKKVDDFEILCRFEALAKDLESENKLIENKNNVETAKISFQNDINNFKSKFNNSITLNSQLQHIAFECLETAKIKEYNLTKEEEKALYDLSKDKTIIVNKADKGNAIVIQNKSDYENKMFDLLSDKSKFECLEYDPTIERENSLKSFLNRLRDNFNKNEFRNVKPEGSKAGVLYGLTKVHKKNNAIRPIISSRGTYN